MSSGSRMTVVLSAVCVIGWSLAFYFWRQAGAERSRTATTKHELAAKVSELSARESQLNEVQQRLAATAASNVQDQPAGPPASSLSPRLPFPASGAAPSTQRFNPFRNPAVRESMNRQLVAMYRPIYDGMLTQLNVSPEQRDQFYGDLLKYEAPTHELNKMPADAADDTERAQIEGQISAIRQQALDDIRNLLGPQGYAMYDEYRKTSGDRMLVQQFRQQSTELQMNDWQYDRLRDTLIQTHAQYPTGPQDDFSAAHEAAISQAAQFLAPPQLDAFRKYLQGVDAMNKEMRKLHPPPGG